MHQDINTDSDFIRLDFDVTQQDVRKTDKQIVDLIKEMFVELRQIRDDSKQMRQDLHLHIQDEKSIIQHAFPDGDAEGHRRAHDAWIKRAESQAKFWETLYTTLRIGGILSVVSFLLLAGWIAFLKGPPK
jgi:hypothetical protein